MEKWPLLLFLIYRGKYNELPEFSGNYYFLFQRELERFAYVLGYNSCELF
jgi:hypothetical protein